MIGWQELFSTIVMSGSWPCVCPLTLCCVSHQRFKMERKLDRELKQTEATESREKKSKVVCVEIHCVFN